MRNYTRMKRIFLEGLLWLYLFHFGFTALSLEPGYLDFDNLPDTNFTCVGKVIGGYYADLEANCQMFHVCTIGQADEPMDIRFLCLNGTVFDQETRVCERIDEVDCSKSEQFYSLNLELYGNSGPILEESSDNAQETEPPSIIIKSTTSTTTTTTSSTRRPSNRPTYFTTGRPPAITTIINQPHVVSTHHFPLNAPDIRFNPEEINISLNPGAPPDIRTKHFLSQGFSDNSQDLVNDNVNSDEEPDVKVQKLNRHQVSSSTSPKTIYSINNNNNKKLPENSEDDFGFSEEEYQTELPQRQQQFLIQTNSFRHRQSFPQSVSNKANQYHHQYFHSTTAKQDREFQQDPGHTTLRTVYLQSLKPPEIHEHHHYTHHPRTEKPPQRVQIPIPLLPTLPPLTFSSPAPFTLQRHIETKRYTKDHQTPPRIIISASASVSDASGRRLNYSLGTIGAAQLLPSPPSSYDDYKDSDVSLDPFYHDVPKLNQKKRKRRSTEQKDETQGKINPFDIIKNEQEAVDVLKFLFTWYQSHQATATVPPVTRPATPDLIHRINHEFAPEYPDSTLLTDSSEIHFTNSNVPTSTESLKPEYQNSELFKKNGRYSIIGGYKNLHTKPKVTRKNYLKGVDDNSYDSISEITREGKNIEADYPEVIPDRLKEDKNIELETSLTKAVSETSEFKEKMDDAKMTIVKDMKEVYFNPYDYVDDNYEGVVYKETNPIIETKNKTVDLHVFKEEEKNKSADNDQIEKFSVPSEVVSELYKYLNVNQKETSTIGIEDSFENNSSKNGHNEHSGHNIMKNDNQRTIDTRNDNESTKFTEINVLSEVNEDDKNIRSSSTTSTTSTTTTATTTNRPYSRRNEKRRGRTRPRNHNHIENNINQNVKDHSSTAHPQIRKSRNRGRSRYTDFRTTSTTTELNVQNTIVNENTEESFTTISQLSNIPSLNESILEANSTADILSESTPQTAIQSNFNDDSVHSETTYDNHITEERDVLNTNTSKETWGHFPKKIISEEDSLIHSAITIETDNNSGNNKEYLEEKHTDANIPQSHDVSEENKTKIQNDESLEIQAKNVYFDQNTYDDDGNPQENGKSNDDLVSKNYLLVEDTQKNIEKDNIISNYEFISTVENKSVPVEISTVPFTSTERDHSNENEDDVETTITTENLNTETTTAHLINEANVHFSDDEDSPKSLSKLKPNVETTDDPTYVLKLLRYFAGTAMTLGDDKTTTETSVVPYEPLTENQVTTTEKPPVPSYNHSRTRSRVYSQRRGRPNKNQYRHSSRVITTELPTLRDLHEHSKSSGENIKDDIVKNEGNITDLTNDVISVNADQTTKASLDIPTTDFEENQNVKTKSELLERLSQIEKNLTEKLNFNSATNIPIADTTATTPFVSFKELESFGTTISTTTEPTQSVATNTQGSNDLTNIVEINTESDIVTTKKNKISHSFYDDVFVVPELTDKTPHDLYSIDNKNADEFEQIPSISETTSTSQPTTFTLDQSEYLTTTEESEHGRTDTIISDTTTMQTANRPEVKSPSVLKLENEVVELVKSEHVIPKLISTLVEPNGQKNNNVEETSKFDTELSHLIPDTHETITTIIINLEDDFHESTKRQNDTIDTTLQPDVEVEKSISLPVSILQTSFDISHDINNAQDINNLASPHSDIPSTPHAPKKLHEFIQDIETTTGSIVAKDDQIKLGITESYDFTATETLPTTLVTTDGPTISLEAITTRPGEEHLGNLEPSLVPEVQHNATEILFVKDTESPKTSDDSPTTSQPAIVPVDSLGMINSSHLLQVVVETTTIEPVTTILTTTSIPYHARRTKPPRRRPYYNSRSKYGRHRFSTQLLTSTSKPEKQKVIRYKQNLFTSPFNSDNITAAPLHRSATPTQSELKKVSLRTTPLSSKNSRVPTKVNKLYVFNCFGKDLNTFYADPRDCRLFHYCTQGYSKNQLLDLKFVCDQKTFFDDEKSICTKVKPLRCL